NAGVHLYRIDETDLVEAVIDTGNHARKVRCGALVATFERSLEVHEQRQGEEAVRDRRAERPSRGPLGVDVDELMVVRDVGELVDQILGDLEPVTGPVVEADVALDR